MSDIAKIVGQRIRNYRMSKGWSQETLAELSDFHPTYIGQVERGEKNATIESLEKISKALNVPLSRLFKSLEPKRKERAIFPWNATNFSPKRRKKNKNSFIAFCLKWKNIKRIEFPKSHQRVAFCRL